MTNKISRRNRAEIPEQDYGAGDDRSEQAVAIIRAADAGREIVAEVFGGLALHEAKMRAVLEARSTVAEQWGKAQAAALRVGQTLLALSRTLTVEEFRLVRRGSERLFAISDSLATKLRLAALTVEEHRIPLDQAPPYTVLYEFSTLSSEGQDLVRERGLLRPDLKRGEIVAVRQELKRHKITVPMTVEGMAEEEAPSTSVVGEPDLAALRAEVEAIEGQEAALHAELKRLLDRKAELLRVLSPNRGDADA